MILDARRIWNTKERASKQANTERDDHVVKVSFHGEIAAVTHLLCIPRSVDSKEKKVRATAGEVFGITVAQCCQ